MVYRGREANEPPACRITPAWYRDIARLRHLGNSENRIDAAQSPSAQREHRARGAAEPLAAVGAHGHYSGMVHRLFFPGRVAEWQTRWLQVPVSFGTWGFKSPFAHQVRYTDRGAQAANPSGSVALVFVWRRRRGAAPGPTGAFIGPADCRRPSRCPCCRRPRRGVRERRCTGL